MLDATCVLPLHLRLLITLFLGLVSGQNFASTACRALEYERTAGNVALRGCKRWDVRARRGRLAPGSLAANDAAAPAKRATERRRRTSEKGAALNALGPLRTDAGFGGKRACFAV
jgi:hypothetical protein